MLVLGLGLGMVMQVLVLAVQNAVDYRHMGVATSGSLLFRQVGGSIGIAIFGAIFANRLHGEPRANLPPGVQRAEDRQPGGRHAAAAARCTTATCTPFAAALHPVFVVAAVISALSFLLTWLLREVPLRDSTRPLDGEEFDGSPRRGSGASSSVTTRTVRARRPRRVAALARAEPRTLRRASGS